MIISLTKRNEKEKMKHRNTHPVIQIPYGIKVERTTFVLVYNSLDSSSPICPSP